jgi:hypothetical protein
VKLDWSAIVEYAVSGAIVSWPVFVIGLVASHRRAVRRLDQVTSRQTGELRQITDDQTGELLSRLPGDRLDPYHQHEREDLDGIAGEPGE